ETGQRPDARNYGYAAMFDAFQEILQLFDIEDRLRDDILSAGFDLPFEAANFVIEIDRAWIDPYADDKGGWFADRIAAGIDAVIQPVDQIHQPDRVDVENGCRIGIGPHLRRIAGDDQEIS